MFKMIGNEITISKGDTYAFKIHLLLNGEPYILQSGDSVLAHIGQYSQTLTNDGFDYVIWQLPIALNTGRYKYDLTMCYSTGEQYHMNFPTKYDVVGNTEGGDTPEVLEDKTFTENGVYMADEGFAGFRTVTVNVPDPELEALNVTENGTYEPTVYGFSEVTVNVQPELEDKTITENGEYESEAYGFGTVTVNVQPELEDKTITENGVYESEAYGFGEITVEVEPNLQAKTVTENGTVTADEGYDGLSEVVVDCDVIEPLVFSGDCSQALSGSGALVKAYGMNNIHFRDVTNLTGAFREWRAGTDVEEIVIESQASDSVSCQDMCYNNKGLKRFLGPVRISPVDYNTGSLSNAFNNSNVEEIANITYVPQNYDVSRGYAFRDCNKLKKLTNCTLPPVSFENDYSLESLDGVTFVGGVSTDVAPYNIGYEYFTKCYCLRKLPHGLDYFGGTSSNSICCLRDMTEIETANNYYSGSSGYYRDSPNLSHFTFKTDSGAPQVKSWTGKTLDMYKIKDEWYMVQSNYNMKVKLYTDRYEGKLITDQTSYDLYKNDPDCYVLNADYCLYNHTAIVETINSLPDTSASGTNTLKLSRTLGQRTDAGGADNLTDSEIAVAAAKGWTVTLV